MINKPVMMLKNFAASGSIVKRSEAKKALGMTEPQIDNAIAALIKQGHLTRISRGMYKFVPVAEKAAGETAEKIWRAMKVKRVFSYSDIAMLAGTTKEYLYKLFRKYLAEKYIKTAGVRPVHGSGTEKLFRLTLKGIDKARQPNVEQFRPDPLIMDAVNLNRLICSGLAVREEKTALDAINICNRIIDSLKQGMKR